MVYAGEILTGDDNGLGEGQSASGDTGELNHNFNVAGDIDNLITAGSMGTTNAASATPGAQTYQTGFRLSVGGHVGEIETRGTFLGSAIIADSANFLGLGTTQHEEEGTAITPQQGNASAFEGDAPDTADKEGVPSLGDAGRDGGQFNNDNIANAQILGTIFSSKDGHGAVQLEGALDAGNPINDNVDYYGIPLLGGQTVTINLQATGLTPLGDIDLGVFGPEAATSAVGADLIASTFDTRNLLREADQKVTITAKTPGDLLPRRRLRRRSDVLRRK